MLFGRATCMLFACKRRIITGSKEYVTRPPSRVDGLRNQSYVEVHHFQELAYVTGPYPNRPRNHKLQVVRQYIYEYIYLSIASPRRKEDTRGSQRLHVTEDAIQLKCVLAIHHIPEYNIFNPASYCFFFFSCAVISLNRYAHMPEVRRIAKHRHVPRIIKKAAEAERVQRDKERRKVRLLLSCLGLF